MVRLGERLRLRRLGLPGQRPQEPATEAGFLRRAFGRELPIGALGSEAQSASRVLYDRLDPSDVAEVERMAAESSELHDLPLQSSDAGFRRHIALHLGIWLGLSSIAKKTGLNQEQPPPEVHAMARGPLAAAGGLYEADLVADALLAAGVGIEDIRSGLDFGCSSGRVVRVLAAAFPTVRWIGCDPNEPAISWARHVLPESDFLVSGDAPPLPFQDGAFDLVFGISIWSHFEPQLGLRWFEEMRRLIRPGGHLVLTTHGLTSIAYYALQGLRTPQQCEEIMDAMYRRGWWYAAEFGERGDWGVINPAWGTSFLSPEWLLTELCPRWRVLEFAPGRNAGNQDVYVLERA